MADAGAGEKLKVFISYSRKDSTAFVDELVLGLEDRGFAPILDRHDIKPGEPWEVRLGGLIEQSDTVVFVVSPEAVKSERCGWEIEKTLALSKRLLPVIHKPPDTEIPPKLSELQLIRFDTAPGMMRPLRELAEALRVDLQWIREHTRLGELAMRWDGRGRPESLLLRGDEIDAAKTWMTARNAAAPEITDAQRAFVKASEEAESARLGKERAQLEVIRRAQYATARQQRRIAWLLGGVAALVLAMIGYVTWQSYEVARRELNVFTARATDALHDEQFDRAMRYALQAYPARGRLPWTTPFSTELEGKLAGAALSTQLHRQLKGHWKAVESAAFSGDGKRVVTASRDGTARIWDAESGTEVVVLKGHDHEVLSAMFSADGKRVVTASSDGTARIWDAESGNEIIVLKGHHAAFSANGKRVVTRSDDNTARIWDAESGREIAVLKGHTDSVNSATFSGDGKRVVTASEDKTARIWDAESGREVAVLKGRDPVNSAAFSTDGNRVVTAPRDVSARIWDAQSGTEVAVLKGHVRPISSAAFSGDDTWVATTSYDSTARIWDAVSGNELLVLKGHAGSVFTLMFSDDGKRVVTASDDNTARVWDVEGAEAARMLAAANGKTGGLGDPPWDGKEIAVLKGHTGAVRTAAFSGDGKRVVTASRDGSARIWNAQSGTEVAILKGHKRHVLSAVFSADDKRVVTASSDSTARIWDAESGTEVVVLKGHAGEVHTAAFSGDGKRVVTASRDGSARIWDTKSGMEVAALKGHAASVNSAAFSGDGKRVVTASEDRTARIWDAESGSEVAALKGHDGALHRAAFSADGKRVLTASKDNTARIWDAQSGTEIAVLKGHDREVLSAMFSTDDKRVVTAAFDDAARIWNAETGKEVAILKGHRAPLSSAAFTGDGKRVVTTALDGTARIWDAESGKEIAVLKGHALVISSAAFSGDGKRVVAAAWDGTARIWDVTWATLMRADDLRERVCAEKLIGAAQEFTDGEMEDPILRGIDKDDPVARNPCLRRGPLSLDYWIRIPGQLRRLASGLSARIETGFSMPSIRCAWRDSELCPLFGRERDQPDPWASRAGGSELIPATWVPWSHASGRFAGSGPVPKCAMIRRRDTTRRAENAKKPRIHPIARTTIHRHSHQNAGRNHDETISREINRTNGLTNQNGPQLRNYAATREAAMAAFAKSLRREQHVLRAQFGCPLWVQAGKHLRSAGRPAGSRGCKSLAMKE